MKIPKEILAVLREHATTDGSLLRIGGPRLDPRTYARTDEILQGAGGRWDKKQQAHVFPGDAAQAVAALLAAREVTTVREARQQQQYFPTPQSVVTRLLDLADLAPGMEVLEPSAGRGAIVSALVGRGSVVDAVELDPDHARELKEVGEARTVTVADFLALPADPSFDRVVMNPPFTRLADVTHVRHALGFLRPGGLLVSVMSNAAAWRKEAVAFRRLVADHGGTVEPVPAGAFNEAGTNIATLLVTIPATRPAGELPACVWPGGGEEQPAPTRAPEPEPEKADELLHPAVIARQIERELRASLRIIGDLARDLERGGVSEPVQVSAQLSFDLGEEL